MRPFFLEMFRCCKWCPQVGLSNGTGYTFDCLEVDIALKRDRFDEAFPGIDGLLARPLHQTHGARPLSRGLVNIHRTLEKLIAAGTGPVDQMRLASSQVRARAEELHQQIVSQGIDY